MTRGEAAMIMARILEQRHQKQLAEEEHQWEFNKKRGFLSCETCAGGKDLKDQEWIKNPFVEIIFGQLYVDGVNETRLLTPLCTGCILHAIREADLRHTPLTKKMQVDQLYPELYLRATGMTGGVRILGEFYQDPEGQYPIFLWDGSPINEGDQAFEESLVLAFQSLHLPVYFQDWIKTEAAKAFLYDTIIRWQDRDHRNL